MADNDKGKSGPAKGGAPKGGAKVKGESRRSLIRPLLLLLRSRVRKTTSLA